MTELDDPVATELDTSGILETGGTARISTISTHCGVYLLDREVNGTAWQSDTGSPSGDWIPPGWETHVDEFERIDVVIELVSPDELEITPIDSTETLVYIPTETQSQCD